MQYKLLIMENEIMKEIGAEAMDASREWIINNPGILEKWLDGEKIPESKPALTAVRTALGIE